MLKRIAMIVFSLLVFAQEGKPMILLNTPEGWKAIQVETKKEIPWNIRETTDPAEVFKDSYWQQGHYLMSISGALYKLNVPGLTRGVSLSPDNTQLVYTLKTGDGFQTKIMLSDLEGTQTKELATGHSAKWLPDGSVSYRDGDELSGQNVYRIRASSLESDAINPELIVSSQGKLTFPQWSPDFKTLAYKSDNAIWTVNADGTNNKAIFIPEFGASTLSFAWSPDSSQLAFMHKDPLTSGKHTPWNLWVISADGANANPLLDVKALSPNFLPIGAYKGVSTFQWSADSKQLVFQAAFKGDCRLQSTAGNISCRYDLYAMNADGSNQRRLTRLKLEHAGAMKWF